ncbi:ribonuclease H-like domain-containing protein [Podospora australis]|uniref:Ribonuclease H-like domain-containing protein n=1 Tax=Podospora australis TaxID=1536484 RepID=A0AAN6WVU7_9PEZI|nr:ribonuclease H-like domain-containing protein [Podospora australis]
MATTVRTISTPPDLWAFLAAFPSTTTIYLDLEGTNLSRRGTLSIITMLLHPQSEVYLIDVATLGSAAFTESASDAGIAKPSTSCTLKGILEDSSIQKCLWDVRNDADALWSLYGVKLANVLDIQLLENASRPGDKTFLRGLDKCVQCDLQPQMTWSQRRDWAQTKQDVSSLMRTSTDLFDQRPMPSRIIDYCVGDVLHLPALRSKYEQKLLFGQTGWLVRVDQESENRLVEARSPGYQPHGRQKAFGPWSDGRADGVRRWMRLNGQ